MAVGNAIGTLARQVDRRFGIRAWLRGEPRPPAGGFDLDGEKNSIRVLPEHELEYDVVVKIDITNLTIV